MPLRPIFELALALIGDLSPLTLPERTLVDGIAPSHDSRRIRDLLENIRSGGDPLGEFYAEQKTAADRRLMGQTFTPRSLVSPMIERALTDENENGQFQRVIDPGAGSGRYVIEAARAFPSASLIAVEADPACILLLRANLVALGLTDRVKPVLGDFCDLDLPSIGGRTLFIGNPPYVRHHAITKERKAWYAEACRSIGEVKANKLAGLHIYFFIKAALLSKPGDFGIFITAAEWLNARYGSALRSLLLGRIGAFRSTASTHHRSHSRAY